MLTTLIYNLSSQPELTEFI